MVLSADIIAGTVAAGRGEKRDWRPSKERWRASPVESGEAQWAVQWAAAPASAGLVRRREARWRVHWLSRLACYDNDAAAAAWQPHEGEKRPSVFVTAAFFSSSFFQRHFIPC